ncbi:MAG: DegT/DnrJ/EryC1/StrS family aminotransferase [Spirochaetaceae bacterium]|jgi:dTDP-4-amino-4,6-dideoxygalactose transaminase|nr:DegT/DnrJ/EryC1/StrS family aminotransferase [Spirochaetaceae bacterium]
MKIEVYSPTIRRKEMDAVLTVLVEEKIGPGEQAQRLVQIAKENLHFDYALALRSPAMALNLAIKMFKPDDERGGVLISALSPQYYLRVIDDAGMVPVICDVDSSSGCVSADLLKAAAEKAGDVQVRCIALYEGLGILPDMLALAELGIPLIEDCSASYGAALGERKAGTFGTLSILGLEERDLLTAGGGALLFAMERRNAAALRNLPELPPEYGLPDMNAAMAIVQFREAARCAEKREEIARLYTDAAMRGRHKRFLQVDDFIPNNIAFPLILETGMKDVAAYAKKKEIAVESAFSTSVIGALPTAGELYPAAYSLSLRTALFPIYPRLGTANAANIAKLILTLP